MDDSLKRVPSREAGFKKSHRDFIRLYRYHDIAVEYLKRLASVNNCVVEDYGLERRHSRKYYYFDWKPDLRVRCSSGLFYVEVKAKRLGVVPEYVYVNVRHARNYVRFAEHVRVPVYLFVAIVPESKVVGELWFDVLRVPWDNLPVVEAWDKNKVYVLHRKYSISSPFLYNL